MANAERFTMPGFSRYYFTLKGGCYNVATEKALTTEQMAYGEQMEYYSPIDDKAKRRVLYVNDIITYCKEQKAIKDKKITVISDTPLPKGFELAPKKKPYPKTRCGIKEAREIRALSAEGKTSKQISALYGISTSQVNKIVAGTHLPEPI